MTKLSLLKDRLSILKPKKKVVKTYVPNADIWNIATVVLLIMTVFYHVQALSGWLDGTTMVKNYGIDPVLADAIAKCPDILFHTTYYAMGVSVILLGVTAYVFYRYLVDEMEGYDALNIAVGGAIVSVWAFPLLHAVLDLLATATDLRPTNSFDVFQLGIAGWPLLITTVVCAVIMWVNKRVHILT